MPHTRLKPNVSVTYKKENLYKIIVTVEQPIRVLEININK